MAFNPGGSSGLATAADVALNSPADNQILGYNTAVGKWQNRPQNAQLIENVHVINAAGGGEVIPDIPSATISQIRLDAAQCTLTFPTAVAGKSFLLSLVQDATGGRTVVWPNTIKWQGGIAPTLTATSQKQDVFSFICIDGVNWLGFVVGQNF